MSRSSQCSRRTTTSPALLRLASIQTNIYTLCQYICLHTCLYTCLHTCLRTCRHTYMSHMCACLSAHKSTHVYPRGGFRVFWRGYPHPWHPRHPAHTPSSHTTLLHSGMYAVGRRYLMILAYVEEEEDGGTMPQAFRLPPPRHCSPPAMSHMYMCTLAWRTLRAFTDELLLRRRTSNSFFSRLVRQPHCFFSQTTSFCTRDDKRWDRQATSRHV